MQFLFRLFSGLYHGTFAPKQGLEAIRILPENIESKIHAIADGARRKVGAKKGRKGGNSGQRGSKGGNTCRKASLVDIETKRSSNPGSPPSNGDVPEHPEEATGTTYNPL